MPYHKVLANSRGVLDKLLLLDDLEEAARADLKCGRREPTSNERTMSTRLPPHVELMRDETEKTLSLTSSTRASRS